MAFFSQSPAIGVNVAGTETSRILPDGSTSGSPSFGPGTRVLGSDGTQWQYGQAISAITAGAVCAIATSGTCGRASVGDAIAGRQLCFAQNAFAAAEWGWFALNGSGGPNNQLSVLVSSTATALAALYISSSTGILSTQGSSSATVAGVWLNASASATAGVTYYAAIATWPRISNSVTSGPQGV